MTLRRHALAAPLPRPGYRGLLLPSGLSQAKARQTPFWRDHYAIGTIIWIRPLNNNHIEEKTMSQLREDDITYFKAIQARHSDVPESKLAELMSLFAGNPPEK
jgi:hypothetical protein